MVHAHFAVLLLLIIKLKVHVSLPFMALAYSKA